MAPRQTNMHRRAAGGTRFLVGHASPLIPSEGGARPVSNLLWPAQYVFYNWRFRVSTTRPAKTRVCVRTHVHGNVYLPVYRCRQAAQLLTGLCFGASCPYLCTYWAKTLVHAVLANYMSPSIACARRSYIYGWLCGEGETPVSCGSQLTLARSVLFLQT